MRKLAIAALLLAVSPPPAAAWNNAGHMTAAGVAYLSLSPEVRTRVDELLRQHPDFARIAGDFPPDDPDFGAVVFMRAAIWPDLIRGDSRFFDDTNPEAEPTPALPGFPDMGIHKPWHFIDLPFTFDAAAVSQPDEVNALTQIVAFRSALGDPDVTASEQAYDLSWLLHLVGDIHQPLHSAARFSALHPSGDRGGNSFLINSNERNLHSFWDRSLGTDDDPERALALAGQLRERFRRWRATWSTRSGMSAASRRTHAPRAPTGGSPTPWPTIGSRSPVNASPRSSTIGSTERAPLRLSPGGTYAGRIEKQVGKPWKTAKTVGPFGL